jgi:hypothetical protein
MKLYYAASCLDRGVCRKPYLEDIAEKVLRKEIKGKPNSEFITWAFKTH